MDQKKHARREREYLSILKAKTDPSKKWLHMPDNAIRPICSSLVQLTRNKISVCVIDIEKQTIKMEDGRFKCVPIWITILNQNVQIIYNQFVRHPVAANHQWNEEFHGLTHDDVRYAPHFLKSRNSRFHGPRCGDNKKLYYTAGSPPVVTAIKTRRAAEVYTSRIDKLSNGVEAGGGE